MTMKSSEETNLFRAALEYLAESRGLSGAEELADKAAAAGEECFGREWTPREVLEAPPMGFGNAVEAALGGMSNAEMRLLSRTFGRTYLRRPEAREVLAADDARREVQEILDQAQAG